MQAASASQPRCCCQQACLLVLYPFVPPTMARPPALWACGWRNGPAPVRSCLHVLGAALKHALGVPGRCMRWHTRLLAGSACPCCRQHPPAHPPSHVPPRPRPPARLPAYLPFNATSRFPPLHRRQRHGSQPPLAGRRHRRVSSAMDCVCTARQLDRVGSCTTQALPAALLANWTGWARAPLRHCLPHCLPSWQMIWTRWACAPLRHCLLHCFDESPFFGGSGLPDATSAVQLGCVKEAAQRRCRGHGATRRAAPQQPATNHSISDQQWLPPF